MSGNSTEPIQGDDASGSDKEPANRENEGEASLKPKPSHVSDRMWMKFQSLQKRREDMCKRSIEKRSKELARQVTEKVVEEFQGDPDDMDMLRQNNVRFPWQELDKTGDKTQNRKRKADKDEGQSSDAGPSQKQQEHWDGIKQYLDVNDHLKGVGPGKYAQKTKIEEKIDKAIEMADFKRAEELSDTLATREFGKRISDAMEARDYMEQKKIEEQSAKAKKKKKLHWGFEHKQRWETKGNM